MATEKRTYTGVTRSMFEELRDSMSRFAVPIPPGDQGSISSNGMTGSFSYDERAAILELTIEKTPLFLPRSVIWKAVDGAVAGARGAQTPASS